MMLNAPPFGDGQRIGLFGGSFNPAHRGHYMVALYALKRLELDWVWWLVSPQNPLKDPSETGEYAARLAYTQAIARHPRFVVTDIEKQMGARTTAETLRGLKPLLTRGAFRVDHGGRQFRQSAPLARLAGDHRNPAARRAGAARLFAARAGRSRRHALRRSAGAHPARAAPRHGMKPPAWCFIPMPLRPESSTAIRKKLKRADVNGVSAEERLQKIFAVGKPERHGAGIFGLGARLQRVIARALDVAEAPLQTGRAVEARTARRLHRQFDRADGVIGRRAVLPIITSLTVSADKAPRCVASSMKRWASCAPSSSVCMRPTSCDDVVVGRRFAARSTAMAQALSATPR